MNLFYVNNKTYEKILPLAIVSLPFTKALTIDIGFPVKFYEIVLLLACSLFFIGGIKVVKPASNIFVLLILFSCITGISSLYNVFFPAEGFVYADINFRFGPLGATITKIVYLFFVSISFYLLTVYSFNNNEKFYRYWMFGAVLCFSYTLYLFLSSLFGIEPYLLPGISSPQKFNFAKISLIRSGTFEEGNFLGLYFLLSLILSIYKKHHKLTSLFVAGIFMTLSSINILVLFLIALIFSLKRFSRIPTIKRIKILIFISVIAIFGFGPLLKTKYVEEVFFNKFVSPIGSAADRFDQSVAGIRMFCENPFFGVGHGNYGYYYKEYRYTDIFEKYHEGKMIANNVYVEILSETGIVGFLLFILIFAFIVIHVKGKETQGNKLKVGIFSILFVFIAYPSYIAIFVWAYLAYVTGLFCNLKKQRLNENETYIY